MLTKLTNEHWTLANGMWDKLCEMKDAPEPERYNATVAAMRELAEAMCGQYHPDALSHVASAFEEVLRGGECCEVYADMYWESVDEEDEDEVLDSDIAGEWSSADCMRISFNDFRRDKSLDEKYNRLTEEAAYHIAASLCYQGDLAAFCEQVKVDHDGEYHGFRIDKEML